MLATAVLGSTPLRAPHHPSLTLKFNGTMLNTLITSNIHDFSSSAVDTLRHVNEPTTRERPLLPVPKLGPPLNARPDHKCPCITPALTSSRNKYSDSWNLSFRRACLTAVYIALANGECMWEFNRNLQFQSLGSCLNCPSGENSHSPPQFKETPNNVCDNFVFFVQLTSRQIRLSLGSERKLFRCSRTQAQREIDR